MTSMLLVMRPAANVVANGLLVPMGSFEWVYLQLEIDGECSTVCSIILRGLVFSVFHVFCLLLFSKRKVTRHSACLPSSRTSAVAGNVVVRHLYLDVRNRGIAACGRP